MGQRPVVSTDVGVETLREITQARYWVSAQEPTHACVIGAGVKVVELGGSVVGVLDVKVGLAAGPGTNSDSPKSGVGVSVAEGGGAAREPDDVPYRIVVIVARSGGARPAAN